MKNYTISEEIYQKCLQFAKDSVGTNSGKYASRNQFNVEKITKDIQVGKIGEECAYNFLTEKFPNLTKPDYVIYSKKDKSWSPDLKDLDSSIKIAVKSQNIDSAQAHGDSWVFQHRPNKKYDSDKEVFGDAIDQNQYVSFVSLNVPKRIGSVQAIVKIQWLHDNNLFKPMQKINLRDNKVAVYFEDLELFKDQLWQI